jgi:hypothetical protein
MGRGLVMSRFNAVNRFPIATAWVTTDNITGTGTSVVETTVMNIPMASLPAYTDLIVEVQFTQVRTGGTGSCLAWAKFPQEAGAGLTSDGAGPTVLYSTAQFTDTTPRTRVVRARFPFMMDGYSGAPPQKAVYVRAKGSAGDTEWAVSDIKARLIYTPL